MFKCVGTEAAIENGSSILNKSSAFRRQQTKGLRHTSKDKIRQLNGEKKLHI